jgi:hypothetical protein
MKVINEITVYEIDGKDTGYSATPMPHMEVLSHWNCTRLVVLRIGETSYTVSRDELEKAITNACNWQAP